MTPKKLWIICAIFLLIHLIIQNVFYLKNDLTDGFGLMILGVDLFSNLIMVGILGTVLGALIALVPFRQKKFKEKFKTSFPLLTSVVLLILISACIFDLTLK